MNLVGEWDFTSECVMGPDGQKARSTGREKVRALGELWVVGEMEGNGEPAKTATHHDGVEVARLWKGRVHGSRAAPAAGRWIWSRKPKAGASNCAVRRSARRAPASRAGTSFIRAETTRCPPEVSAERLQEEAINAVLSGAQCLILDDTAAFVGDRLWLDPLLVTAAIDRALRQADDSEFSLRRLAGIVVRSGALRDLHDLALCISMGANAVVPYSLYAVGLGIAPRASKEILDSEQIVARMSNTVSAMMTGIQKITSTIGCHELRGYGHSFGSIGLASDVATVFGMPNYFGSNARGLTFERLLADAELRSERSSTTPRPSAKRSESSSVPRARRPAQSHRRQRWSHG